jgi:archaellum biogenesis protein FlaJ (TadC family)
MIDDIMDVIDLWRVDSADEKTKNEITELSKWANIFVATNTSVCLLCIATVSFSSNENDGLEFIRYVLDQIFSQWGKLALVLIKMSLFLACLTMPGVTYQLFYVTQHIRMQMKLFKMFIRSLANTLSSTEENLTRDNNYQEEIHTQLKIIIDRHCDFIR